MSRPGLNFQSHGERVRRMMAEWRDAQGKRAADGNQHVMHALEFMATPYANVACWTNDPEPLRLSRGQVRICQQRAISQERRRRHGPPGLDGEEWWSQIQTVATEWGIPVEYDEWAAKKTTKEAA